VGRLLLGGYEQNRGGKDFRVLCKLIFNPIICQIEETVLRNFVGSTGSGRLHWSLWKLQSREPAIQILSPLLRNCGTVSWFLNLSLSQFLTLYNGDEDKTSLLESF
jgi:hypothetical protein